MIKLGYTKNPDTYEFSNNFKLELILYPKGFIIARTNIKPKTIELYNPLDDSIVTSLGFCRVSNFYSIKMSYPFIELSSSLKKSFKN